MNANQYQYLPRKPLAPDAWAMWNNLKSLADFLWDTYHDDFLVYANLDQNTARSRNYYKTKLRFTEENPPF